MGRLVVFVMGWLFVGKRLRYDCSKSSFKEVVCFVVLCWVP